MPLRREAVPMVDSVRTRSRRRSSGGTLLVPENSRWSGVSATSCSASAAASPPSGIRLADARWDEVAPGSASGAMSAA
jgi:hypothetical protein